MVGMLVAMGTELFQF